MKEKIFVFGSNLAGRHGKGAAEHALKHKGAIYGQGYGLQGNSFGIPTKDKDIKTLSLKEIERYVTLFVEFASSHPELDFELTPIGCGLAGYKPYQIALMFKEAPSNVFLPQVFLEVLQNFTNKQFSFLEDKYKENEELHGYSGYGRSIGKNT